MHVRDLSPTRASLALALVVAVAATACGGGDSGASIDSGTPMGPGMGPGSGAEGGVRDSGLSTDAHASDAGGNPGDGGHAGDSGAHADAPSGSPDGGAVSLPRPSQASVSDAITTGLSSYHRNASTGDIWCLPCDGAPVMLAAAAYAGDTSVDMRLLDQMRYLLSGGNDPFATGGYAANDERNATAMYAIAKLVPRIWSQLTASELHKIDLVMEATLVASAYTTADATNMSGAPLSIEGSNDPNRDFNPNYREGMIGAVLVGTEYFGGQQATEALLGAFDDASFVADLQTNGLTNAYWTFSTYMHNAAAPNPQAIQQGIMGYAMHGLTLGQLFDIYLYLANDTFSATVACGLNGGAGIQVGSVSAGRIVSGCSGLPNLGAVGMEKEFDSVDGNGPRSDAGYVRLGLRTNLFNQLVLLVYGGWQTTAAGSTALQQVGIGVTDFFYKATQGYESYSHGTDEGLFNCTNMDCPLNQAVWTEILAPAHGI